MLRVIKNNSRIGKPWLLVEGDYYQGDYAAMKGKGPRWKTKFQLAEFHSKEAAYKELDFKVKLSPDQWKG